MSEVLESPLAGVKIVIPSVFEDDRGYFMETFNQRGFAECGLPEYFAQDNHSKSVKGVLRGLHYQHPTWQGKLVRAVAGEVFDVAVDIRRSSANFGRWFGIYLSAENRKQLYVPPGFAHGFCAVSDVAEVVYKCTTVYIPSEDAAILWNDPDIGIDWPIERPNLSAKDRRGQALKEINID